jgi:hypothetical protein
MAAIIPVEVMVTTSTRKFSFPVAYIRVKKSFLKNKIGSFSQRGEPGLLTMQPDVRSSYAYGVAVFLK